MQNDVTGGNLVIVAMVLATAYALIGTLPEHCQQASDRHEWGDCGMRCLASAGERMPTACATSSPRQIGIKGESGPSRLTNS
ncbi:hypothetical protein ACFQX4_11745 [Roseomonas sp. GCM10028921]